MGFSAILPSRTRDLLATYGNASARVSAGTAGLDAQGQGKKGLDIGIDPATVTDLSSSRIKTLLFRT
jgi:hypothetical protein